jgi:DNA-binding transcriptional MerR regulator
VLTISQLAAYAGVTVRAVRHYHQRGLLPEPERDSSGYRRYDAQAVIDLLRIKTLADAGVPLARVDSLLSADPSRLADTVEELDAELARRIKELRDHRKRLAQLAAGERLYLPEQVVAYLDRLREIGISDRLIESERDAWILLAARMPEHVGTWATEKRVGFDDPEFRRLYLAYDVAYDWDPDDPRLAQIAADALTLMLALYAGKEPTDADMMIMNDREVLALISSHALKSPAWTRLEELASAEMARLSELADQS